MGQLSAFTIYNASAGSGKTYTLVKAYISILLQSSNTHKYRQLLAITFTNKAVAEMKSRVLSTLQSFILHSQDPEQPYPKMLEDIAKDLQVNPQEISKRSEEILKNILHNYAAFDIVTIDTLTHRILRTFAKDLGLSGNFEVSLQVKEAYEKAVDALIEKAGTDEDITNTLIDFALEKADDDKSWDISFDLNNIAALLTKEQDREAIEELSTKSLSEFKSLKALLKQKMSALEKEMKQVAAQLLEKVHEEGLERMNFSRGSFYDHLTKLAADPANMDFKAAWKQNIEEYSFYTKTAKDHVKESIDLLKPLLISAFTTTKNGWLTYTKFNEFYKKLTPLSVLHLIHQELELIKEEENLLLISDFNKHIYTYLKDQPAAFIYERLGERYSNYFIDEFQDTSIMQWENLIPLIASAIESESQDKVINSLLLVGDPKQAIYRWRGGEAEQFIALSQKKAPFSIPDVEVQPLDTNWRSHEEIILFNNNFFSFLAQEFTIESYKEIYATDNNQKTNFRKGGLVSLSFVSGKTNEEIEPLYLDSVLHIIKEISQQDIPLENICILTRKNSDGAAIAQYLAEQDIRVVSAESLLLSSAPVVHFVHAFLMGIALPNRPETMVLVLEYLADRFDLQDPHHFIASWVHAPTLSMFEMLATDYNVDFSMHIFNELPLYEGVEYLIRALHLDKEGDAFLMGYLDAVFEFTQKNSSGLSGFIAYFEEKKDSLSVKASARQDAVQIMSIHKSKGLEFPIVIFPYADSKINPSHDEHHWLPTDPSEFGGFEQLMFPHKQGLSDMGAQGIQLYDERQGQQQFDAINVLYVALTRAVERLYVISRFRESKSKSKPQYYGQLFEQYLLQNDLWVDEHQTYSWGTSNDFRTPQSSPVIVQNIPFNSSSKEDHKVQLITKAAFLWDEKRQDAISYGNLIHELMGRIQYRDQREQVIDQAVQEGLITQENAAEVAAVLERIMSHSELKELYAPENTVYNERPILSADGETHIPDRIEITPSGIMTIIDYKTGIPQENHEFQLDRYTKVLSTMGYEDPIRKLVYVNTEITVLNV